MSWGSPRREFPHSASAARGLHVLGLLAAGLLLALLAPAAAEEPAPTPAAIAPSAPPAPAVEPTPRPAAQLNVAERQRELKDLRRRLDVLRARYAGTKRREADLKAALDSAELNLQIRTAERRVLELRQAEVERDVVRVRGERDTSASEVERLRLDLAGRVAALYRMGRIGYLRTLVGVDSGRALLRGLQFVDHLARRDAQLIAAYQTSLVTLESRTRELDERQRELAALATESRRKEEETAAARAEKARLLARTQQAGEEERQTVETLEDRSNRLAALLELLEAKGSTLPPGAKSIHRYRGVLDWPVTGKVVVPFGRIANPKFPKTFLRSSGWTIDVPAGTEVRAIFAGDVVFAQWLKGYGNLVVVDHGEGVFTLYGRLATGTIPRGTHVALGETVGRLADTVADEEIAGLYFEIRDSRASVDPKLWLR